VRCNGKLSLAAMIGRTRWAAGKRIARSEGYLYAEFIVVGRLTQLLVFSALHE
jgi:hypothetical protein